MLAGSCGGAIPCRCGDTVTADYTMTGSLGPCPGHGLVVQSGATLDCQGFAIVGLGDGSEQYGVYLQGDTGAEVTGAAVTRCDVSRFIRGIRLRAADGNVILANASHDNGNFSGHVGYGIDIALASKDNLLQENTVQGNADEGIHLGSGTGPNQLVGNVLFDNYREQLYVLASDGNTFTGNRAYGSGSNSLYLKDSRDNTLQGNTFKDRTARVTGDASGNVFLDNTFVNATLQFRVYEATPDRIPTGNAVSGGSMSHTGTCLRFTRTWGNTVTDVAMDACGSQVLSEGTATEPSSNTIVSIPLDPARVSVDANSTLAVGWWLDLHVRDGGGVPIPGARVQAVDADESPVFDVLTDGGGNLPSEILLQYVQTGSAVTGRTPHTLTTTKNGYPVDSRVLQATQDQDVTVVLSPVSPPPGIPASFLDAFNRPNSTVLGNGWQEVEGDLVLSGGELRNAPVKGKHLAVVPALSGGNQSAAADFASVDNNPAPLFGIVLRYQSPGNYYLLYRLAGGTSGLRISRVVNGTEKVLASTGAANPTLNRFFRLKGQVVGTTLTLELDGAVKLSTTDATFGLGTPGVLLSQSSTKSYRADNFGAALQ